MGVLSIERLLPDVPRWVEVRGMFLAGRGAVIGPLAPSPPSFVALQADAGLAAVVGHPPPESIRRAAERAKEVVAAAESRDWTAAALPGWRQEDATIHQRPPGAPLPEVVGDSVRLLEPADALPATAMAPELRAELDVERRAGSPIAVAFDRGSMAAFCYAGATTETLWDVAIETLDPFRRRGHATRCAAWLIRLLAERGRQPVWGAVASNVASMALAARLGFAPVDTLTVFSHP